MEIIIATIISLIVGAVIGSELDAWQWKRNADGPQRILYRNRFYKVIRLRDPVSAQMLNIHREDIWNHHLD